MKPDGIRKLYYSISEVAEATDLEPHVLRFWETEFEQLQPKKNRAGNRIYTDRDIEVVQKLKHLLRHDKYTIEGARQVMDRQDGLAEPDLREELTELRAFLTNILQAL